jgi:hypothetical protein
MAPARTIAVLAVEILTIDHHHHHAEEDHHVWMNGAGIVVGVDIRRTVMMIGIGHQHRKDMVAPHPIRMAMIDIVGIVATVTIGEIDGGIDLKVWTGMVVDRQRGGCGVVATKVNTTTATGVVAMRTTIHHLRATIEIETIVGQNANAKMTRMIHRVCGERRLLLTLRLLQRMMKVRHQKMMKLLEERTPKMKEARASHHDLEKGIEKMTERNVIGRVGEVAAVVGVAVEAAAALTMIILAMDMGIIIIIIMVLVAATVEARAVPAPIPGTTIHPQTRLARVEQRAVVAVVVADIRIETERLHDEVVDITITTTVPAVHNHRRRRRRLMEEEIAKTDRPKTTTTAIAVAVENGNRVGSRLRGDVGTEERIKSCSSCSSNHNPRFLLVVHQKEQQLNAATTTMTIIKRRMVPRRPRVEKIKNA